MVAHHIARPLMAGSLSLLAAGAVFGGVVALGGPASAAGHSAAADDSASGATALSWSGAVDQKGSVASVSSSGAVQTVSKDAYSSPFHTFTAADLKASAGAGTASASIGNLIVGGEDLGSFTGTCDQGVTKVSHQGSAGTGKVHVAVGSDAATITLSAVGGGVTLTAVHVSCAKGAVPPPTSGTNPPPPSSGTNPPPPTSGRHTPPPTRGSGHHGSGVTTAPPASAPTIHTGQIDTTG